MNPEQAGSEIKELEALRTQIRWWRWGITAVIAVTVVGCLLTLHQSVTGLTQDGPQREAFVSQFGSNMNTKIVPQVESLGMQAFHSIDFASAGKKLNERAPAMAQASIEQLNLLNQDIQTRGGAAVNDRFDKMFEERKAKIHALFPEATDEQIASLMTNVSTVASDETGQVTHDLFAPHVASLNNIVVDLDKIRSVEQPNIQGEQPTWQMCFLVSDLLRADLTNSGVLTKGAKS
jgi:hypothetical protein